MIKCEFTDRKGFRLLKVLEGEYAPSFYSFAYLPPYSTENWFGDGKDGAAEVHVDQLLFRLKKQDGDLARYEEFG